MLAAEREDADPFPMEQESLLSCAHPVPSASSAGLAAPVPSSGRRQ